MSDFYDKFDSDLRKGLFGLYKSLMLFCVAIPVVFAFIILIIHFVV